MECVLDGRTGIGRVWIRQIKPRLLWKRKSTAKLPQFCWDWIVVDILEKKFSNEIGMTMILL